ncbi:MAG: DUF6530 family protein [Imperialibacter sp.]
MDTPKHLEHKPIMSVNNYDEKVEIGSDAKALSIGKAQYNKQEYTVKVWRRPGNRWSRQSEEVPIQRVLNMCILAVSSMNIKEGNSESNSSLKEVVDVDEKSMDAYKKFIKDNHECLSKKLEELRHHIDGFLKN